MLNVSSRATCSTSTTSARVGPVRASHGLAKRSSVSPVTTEPVRSALYSAGGAAQRGVTGLAGPRLATRNSVVTAAGPEGDKMVIAITGATGLVGSRLVSKLTSKGHRVKALTRNPAQAKSKLPYRGVEFVAPSDWESALAGCTGVVNLAGEPIATRWSPELRKQIKTSRVVTTKKISDALNALPKEQRPKAFVSASAVGFYGTSYANAYNEESPSGDDYLAEVCREWEAAANAAPSDTRTVVLRLGIVLAREGGALGKMMTAFQLFAGGPLGSGRQWVSWIHRDDLVDLIIEALVNPAYKGVYNATAPKPVRMADMSNELGTVMGSPSWLPVPDFAMQALLGEGASVVLEGQKVLPIRTQKQGFNFKYSDIGPAIRNLVGK